MLDESRLCRNIAAAVIEALKKNELVNDKYMSREEVAKTLNVGYTTLWSWDKLGILKPIRIGRKLHYKTDDVMNILKEK